VYKKLTDKPFEGKKYDWDFTGAAAYSVVAYPGAWLATQIVSPQESGIGQVITAARIGTLLLYVALVTAALWLVRRMAVRWLFFVMALLPMAVFQAATMSPDATLIGLTILMLAGLARLRQPKPFKDKWRAPVVLGAMALAAIAIPLIKPTYAPLSLALLLVPFNLWRPRWQAAVFYVATYGVMAAGLIYWSGVTADVVEAVGRVYATTAQVDAGKQISYVLSHPFQFLQAVFTTARDNDDVWIGGIFGRLGWNFVMIPTSAMIALVTALGIALAQTPESLRRKRPAKWWWRPVALIAIGVVTMMCAIGSLYVGFNPVGSDFVNGMQGRYLIPGLVCLLYGLYEIWPFRLKPADAKTGLAIPLLLAFSAAIACVAYDRSL
jgi:uncharacterized membrane protein